MVERAADYPWSSALAHLKGEDKSGMLDMEWWRREGSANWGDLLEGGDAAAEASLRGCTYAGQPFGEESFVSEIGKRFGRYWTRGRPRKETAPTQKKEDSQPSIRQFPLF